MNQTPAALLIMSASILAFAATAGGAAVSTTESFGLGAVSLLLGAWGTISLIVACVAEREGDGVGRLDLLSLLDLRRHRAPYPVGGVPGQGAAPAPPVAPVPATTTAVHAAAQRAAAEGVTLSPEVKAQLSMVSHLEGRDKQDIIEEALRRYLPGQEGTRAA